MASTAVTVFPVPGGPKIMYGLFEFPYRIESTACFCSGFDAIALLHKL